jgi:hypothetical protein
MSGKSEEGCVRAAVLTEDGGDSGAPIDFAEGETVAGAPNGRRVSTGGGGSSWAHWSEARRSGVEEIKGEEGGPEASRAASGSARGEGGSGAPRGGEDGGGPWLGRTTWGGGGLEAGTFHRRQPVGHLLREQGSGAARVGRPEKGGSRAAPESNSADFDLKRISKLNTN